MPDFQRMTDDPQPFDGDQLRRAQEEHARCIKKWSILNDDRRRMTTFHGVDAHIREGKHRERHDDYG